MVAKKEGGTKFFDTYKDEGNPDGEGSQFLSGDEKQLLIDEGVAFPITEVIPAETKFGARYVLSIELEGEPRKVGFGRGSVYTRDRMLAAVEQHLKNGGIPPEVKIVMQGRAQILVDAES